MKNIYYSETIAKTCAVVVMAAFVLVVSAGLFVGIPAISDAVEKAKNLPAKPAIQNADLPSLSTKLTVPNGATVNVFVIERDGYKLAVAVGGNFCSMVQLTDAKEK